MVVIVSALDVEGVAILRICAVKECLFVLKRKVRKAKALEQEKSKGK